MDDDSRVGAVPDATAPQDGSPDQTSPTADAQTASGPLVQCGACLVTRCARGVITCVQDAKCRSTLQCVATDCLAAGSAPSPACLFKCASGDVEGALAIVKVVQCVTATCGADCNLVLAGGLGALAAIAPLENRMLRPATSLPVPTPLDEDSQVEIDARVSP